MSHICTLTLPVGLFKGNQNHEFKLLCLGGLAGCPTCFGKMGFVSDLQHHQNSGGKLYFPQRMKHLGAEGMSRSQAAAPVSSWGPRAVAVTTWGLRKDRLPCQAAAGMFCCLHHGTGGCLLCPWCTVQPLLMEYPITVSTSKQMMPCVVITDITNKFGNLNSYIFSFTVLIFLR